MGTAGRGGLSSYTDPMDKVLSSSWCGVGRMGNAESLQLGDGNPVPPAAGGIRVRARTGKQEAQNFPFSIIPCERMKTVRGQPDLLIHAILDSMWLVRLADLQAQGLSF